MRELQGRLEDPGLYARDQKAFVETSSALAAAQSELAAAEEQWLELEIKREEIEAARSPRTRRRAILAQDEPNPRRAVGADSPRHE